MNHVTLIGRLGKDPETVNTQSGQTICKFTLATRGYKGATDWHNIVTFNKTAEVCQNYLKKGSNAALGGRIQYEEWTDKEGKKCYRTSIIAMDVELLGSKEKSEGEKVYENAAEDDIPF